MKRWITLVLIILSAASSWSAETFRLTILHTNDLHGMMLPYDYTAPNPYSRKNAGGLARRYTEIQRIRKTSKDPVVLIDCGDLFTRGPWHTSFYGILEIEALNLMGYDMMCIGNNEFKATEGVDSQQKMLTLMRRSRFPWLTANLTVGATGVPVEGIHPYIVRDIKGLRVGFLGLTAPRSKDYPQTVGWTITDPIKAAAYWVPIARKECDVLIGVTHIADVLDEQLASQVAGIDAVVGGDSHTYIPRARMVKNPEGRMVPIVQAGEQGIMLGFMQLTLEKTDGWHVVRTGSRLIPITSSIKEDAAMNTLLGRWLDIPSKAEAPAKKPVNGNAVQAPVYRH